MIYDLSDNYSAKQAKVYFQSLLKAGADIELTRKTNTRSLLQNSALHLFFAIISEQLNELGLEFQYTGVKGMALSVPFTPLIVKEFMWKPIQIALFDVDSTTKINTAQINEIIDVLTKFFGEKGVEIEFPSMESLEKKLIRGL